LIFDKGLPGAWDNVRGITGGCGGWSMPVTYDDYLREQAVQYRQMADKAEDPMVQQELLDLAAVCEEVANKIEDRMTGG